MAARGVRCVRRMRFFVELYRLLGEVVGQASLVSRHSPVWHDLEPAHWRFIYRFCQESVTNLLRHSRADRCRIQLLARHNRGGSCVLVSIRDNDTANYYDFRRADSMGLKNLMSAAEDLGGRCHHRLRPEFKKMAFYFRIPAR